LDLTLEHVADELCRRGGEVVNESGRAILVVGYLDEIARSALGSVLEVTVDHFRPPNVRANSGTVQTLITAASNILIGNIEGSPASAGGVFRSFAAQVHENRST